MPEMNVAETLSIESIKEEYAPEHDPPLGGYALLIGAHVAALAGTMALLRKRDVELGTIDREELFLAGVATYKLSRVITRSWIGTAIRAPFTRYEGQGPGPDVEEEPRASGGVRKAIGDLVTCPFCTAHWVATGLVLGYDIAPGPTRALTRILATDTLSDALQHARKWLVGKADPG